MKKVFLLLAVFALAIYPSCTKQQEEDIEIVPEHEVPGKEDTEEGTGEEITEFSASLPETKTQLGDPSGSAGKRVWPTLWSNGDAINVNGVASNALSTGDGYVGTNYAMFKMESAVSGSPYYAAYPANNVTSYNNGSATITIPAEQTYTAGSYDPDAYIMIGKSATARLNFTPVMGLIQLTTTVPAEGTLYIKSISVEPVGSEKMSGAFSTKTNYSGIQATGSAGNTITINAPSGNTFGFGTVFTFAIPAQNYASGLRFRITATENSNGSGTEKTMVFAKQSAFEVAAGTLYPLTAPAFKESGLTLSCTFLTSSSAGFEWSAANVSNNVKKVWRLAIYSDSGLNTLVVQHDIPADENKSSVWKNQGDGKPRFVVGGLSQGTNYWCKVTDLANGVYAVEPFTTDAFTVVRASSPSGSTLVAEDFSEFGWGPAWLLSYAGHTYGGWAPVKSASGVGANSLNCAAPSGIVNSGYYVANEYSANNFSEQMDFTTTPRFNAGWGFVVDGSFAGYIQAGFLRMGGKNTSRQMIVLPELSGITTDKYATVDVTVKVAHSSSDDVTNNENFAVFIERGLTLSNSARRIYTGSTMDRRYPVSLTARGYNTQTLTFRVNGVKKTDHLMVGPYNNVANCNRYFIYSIKVEKVSESSTETFDITDSETLELFRSRVAAGESSLNGNVVNSFTVSSSVASGWASIPGYTGTLEGNDKTITGLTKPFFNDLQGTVQNLTLNSTLNFTSDQTYIGMFANTMTTGASLSYCTARGSVTFNAGTQGGDEHATGGMVGHADGGSISNCSNYANVTNNTIISANEYSLGGIIGHVWTALDGSFSISNSVNYADVENTGNNTASNICMGGVIGQIGAADNSSSSPTISITSVRNEGVVSNSGDISASIYVGGIAGFTRYPNLSGCSNIIPEDPTTTERVVNSGDATSSIFIGGLVGQSDRKTTYSNACHNTVDIKNTGTAGSIMYMGGIVGGTRNQNTLTSTNSTYNYNNGTLTENSSSETLYIGGICGYANNSSTKLDYCRNESGGDITIKDNTRALIYVGGVIGCTTTNVQFSYARNSGDIVFDGLDISGNVICGGVHGGWTGNGLQTITGCVNSGDIKTKTTNNNTDLKSSNSSEYWSFFGGVSGVGGNLTATGLSNMGSFSSKTFTNCSSSGKITLYVALRTCVGGVIAVASNDPNGCTCTGNIKLIKNSGIGSTGSGSSTNYHRGICGGVIGLCNTTSVSNVKFNATIDSRTSSPFSYTAGIAGYTPSGNTYTFTNCKVGGSMFRAAGNADGGAALFCRENSDDGLSYTFTNCVVKTGAGLYWRSNTKTSISSDNMVFKYCTGWDKSILSSGSVPSVGSID